jgi:hypothetical protein
MDQVKEYLQLAIKYRFWIVVGIAALLPTIAWFATSGALAQAESQKVADIKGAYDGVDKFAKNPTPVIPLYKNLVAKKSEVLSRDVYASWKKLYERQAPLLTWPEEVADTIPVWKRAWPEGTDPRLVTSEIIKYKETYLPYVDKVYQSFKPFDYDTGKGIVVAPSKDALLRHPIWAATDVPSLGKVWDTQQRLWVQGTVLDVVAKVNARAGATNWMTAPIKEVLALEVASPEAQDQKSHAKGEELKESPDVLSPDEQKAAEEEETASSEAGSANMGRMMMQASSGGTAAMMGRGLGGGGLGGGDSGPRAPEPFMILDSTNADQAFIVPIYLSVYIQQERIPDLLVEFQNSPMNIEVLDFAYYKPQPHSVEKPEKGKPPASYGGGGFGMMTGRMGGQMDMRMMMMGGGMGSSRGYNVGGGYSQMMGGQANMSYGVGGYNQSMGGGRGTAAMYGGGRGGEVSVKKEREKVDVGSKNLERFNKDDDDEAANKEDKPTEEDKKSQVADPYYDVVRVEVYGRARFYFPPPEPEQPESQADLGTDEAAADETPAAEGEAKPEADADADGEAMPAEADAEVKPEADAEAKSEGEAAPAGEAPAEPEPDGAEPRAEPGAGAPSDDPGAPRGDAGSPGSPVGEPGSEPAKGDGRR